MDQTFNFNEFTKVSRHISRGDFSPLSRKTNKEGDTTFRFSQEAFTELGLDANSLMSFVSKDKKQVALAVCPGNDGEFLKSRSGIKAKGNSVLHNDLSKSLDEAGYIGIKDFALTKVGEGDGKVWYRITPAEVPTEMAKKAPAVKKEAVAAKV